MSKTNLALVDTEALARQRGKNTRAEAKRVVALRRGQALPLVAINGCEHRPVVILVRRGGTRVHPLTGKSLTTQADIDDLPRGFVRKVRNLGLIRTITGYVIKE